MLLGLSHHWNHAFPAKRQLLSVPVCGGGVTVLWARRARFDAHALALLGELSDVLVVNWGVHYVDDATVAAQARVMLAVLESVWEGKPRHRVFWRASLSAHASCEKEAGDGDATADGTAQAPRAAPARTPAAPRAPTAPNGSAAAVSTRWKAQEVLEQDRAINWPAIRLFGGSVLRVDALTLQRADGHRVDGPGRWRDCLHFCLPGVPDAWGQLLLTALAG